MSAGPPKARRRYTARWETWSILLRFTRLQLETFNAFHRDTVQAGALPFEWRHPETGNQIDFRFIGDPPQKKANAPRNAGKTDVWDVEFQLMTIPGTEVTGSEPPPEDPPDPIIEMYAMAFDPPTPAEPEGAGGAELEFFLVREAIAAEPDVVVWITQLPFDPPGVSDDGDVGFSSELVLSGTEPGGGSTRYSTGDTAPGGGGESSS